MLEMGAGERDEGSRRMIVADGSRDQAEEV